MKVKMLSTQRGTVNNGLGNISMDYLEGTICEPPLEDAEFWLEGGMAVLVPSETDTPPPPEVPVFKAEEPLSAPISPDNKMLTTEQGVDKALDELTPKKGKRRR